MPFPSRLTALIALGAACLVLAVAPAGAQQIDSTYTELDLEQCQPIPPETMGDEEGFGAYWACVGYNNSLVLVAEGDLRMFVSYGQNALNEPAWSQTLPPFNTTHTTLEWRVMMVNGAWQPFATILRYFTDMGDGSEQGQTLVVTKLEPGNTCHIGHVDARKVQNANEAARQIADTYAANFNCATDEIVRVPAN